MKKTKAAALILVLLFVLCGCSHTEVATQTQPEATTFLADKTTFLPATTLYPVTTTQTTTQAETTANYTQVQTYEILPDITQAQSSSSSGEATSRRSFFDFFGLFTRPSSENEKTAETATVSTSKKSTSQSVTTEKKITEKKTTAKKTTQTSSASSKKTTTKSQPTQKTDEPSLQTKSATLTVSVINIKNNMSLLPKAKKNFVPKNGYILKDKKVEISDGDTAFDVLKKGCEQNACTDNCVYCKTSSIQLEYSYTPAYKSYYVEGIHQLYEKDCGVLSGWLYEVNGVAPDASSSTYEVKDGDSVVFIYTCDGGNDIK